MSLGKLCDVWKTLLTVTEKCIKSSFCDLHSKTEFWEILKFYYNYQRSKIW